MKFHKRALGGLALAMIQTVQCHSQVAAPVPAPASLPSCLIQYSSYDLGHGLSRLMLYNSNHTYIDINYYYSGSIAIGTGLGDGTSTPLGPGTFTYAVDPQNPAHATIVYDGGANTDQLYFYGPNSGTQSPSLITAGSASSFTLYPQQTSNGGSNLSNRGQLAAGGTGISGFVIQSGGPRWVLLRAVGTSLGKFGVPLTVLSPALTLYDSTQTIVGASSVWSADPNLVGGYQTIFSLVGAFPLSSGSDEGVLLVPLQPGAYTAEFKAGSAGTILCEAYILPF